MLDQVKKTIKRYRMLTPADRVLVAVSGGVDSVVLLYVLRELQQSEKLSLAVAHFDHAIRPDSAADAEFVRKLARSLKVKFYTGRAEVPAYAKAHKLSLEVAARTLRYQFLERTGKAHNFNKIALGHTLNDQAETLLMRLLRGAGLEGLAGIPPVRPAGELTYVRPLIECTRDQIVAFAQARNLRWREDPTNYDTTIVRNKIRHELIPILKEYNPKVLEALGRTARLLAQAAYQLEREANQALAELTCKKEAHELALDLNKFLKLSEYLQALVLRQAVLHALGKLEAAHIEAVLAWLSRRGAGELHLPDGVRVLRRHTQLIVTTRPAAPPRRFEYLLTVPGETVLPEIGWRFVIRPLHRPLSPRRERGDGGVRGRALLDADKIQGSLVVRNRRPGDRIHLRSGTKKLQDLFTDRKIQREQREAIPLICDENALIWIVGEAVHEDYRATPQTEHILEIRAERIEGVL
ncbi:MAG: tRNA lysidine(34) synthetase TilS [Candidatus Bipolaricaulota bacterium]|nr:tRNA lysidine(34) synthetase TilS [Candidatus Bipolaricaulota bacterium]